MKQLTDIDIAQMIGDEFSPDYAQTRRAVRSELQLSRRIPHTPRTPPVHATLDLHQLTEEQAWTAIMDLAKQNNGIVTTAMVVAAGFPRGSLKYLADNGNLEKASRGVYTLPEVWDDEFVNLQSRYKRGVFSLDTALFLCDLKRNDLSRTAVAVQL